VRERETETETEREGRRDGDPGKAFNFLAQ
jgi:hypothetical protein